MAKQSASNIRQVHNMAIKQRENIWNLPNLLSVYRLVIFPYVLYLIFNSKQEAYLLFFCINIVTDILDGAIARIFKQQTEFGARLDSLADIGSYILAGYGLIHFKWSVISHSYFWITTYLAVFVLVYIISYMKFGKFPSLHLYSSKISGALAGFFFFYLFVWGYNGLLFTIAIAWGILSLLEMIAVLLYLKKLKSDCKGLYWVIKHR